MNELVESLVSKKDNFKSNRLRKLLTKDKEGGCYPSQMKDLVEEFEQMIVWKKTQGSDEEIPEPQLGLDEQFDRANHVVDTIK